MSNLTFYDRVQETTTTTGTGTVVLDGAVTGFQSFAVVGDATTTYYCITEGAAWEVGIGTYTSSGTTLSRDSVLASSNSNSLVDFGAGTKQVFQPVPAEVANDEQVAIGSPVSGGINYDILSIDGSGNVDQIDPSTVNYVLTSNGTSGAATFQAIPALYIGAPIADSSPEGILYTDSGGNLQSIAYGSGGLVLTTQGDSGPAQWEEANVEWSSLQGTAPPVSTFANDAGYITGVSVPGSSGDVLINASSAIGASAMTYSGSTLLLPAVSSAAGELLVQNGTGSFSCSINGAALTNNSNFSLPSGNGTAGELLVTDGSGNTSWGTFTTGTTGQVIYNASGALTSGGLDFTAPYLSIPNSGATPGTIFLTNGSGFHSVGLQPGTEAGANSTFTFPSTNGTAGQYLQTTDNAGTTTWATPNYQPLDSYLTAISNTLPVADGTYTVGIGVSTNGTITTVNGIITAITQAS